MLTRAILRLVALAIVVTSLGGGLGRASDVNEVGALLVYPIVIGLPGHETLLTIANTSADPVVAHVSFIDGYEGTLENPNYNYCNECDFDVELTGNDTELLVVRSGNGCDSRISAEDSGQLVFCPQKLGMVVVTVQNETGVTMTDNILLGSEVIVNYAAGRAYSIPAIPFLGGYGDGDLEHAFDGEEYSKFPRIVAANFVAPDVGNAGPVTADLGLFTLGFDRGFPPVTDCSVTGFDSDESPFSASFRFGCWTWTSLWSISPEFAYPDLGIETESSHGWIQLSCRVDSNADGTWDAVGGVHGLIQQSITPPAPQRPPFGGTPSSDLSWSRLLFESVTTGDSLVFRLGAPGTLD